MTLRKPLLLQKDRRGIGRIPARDFLTPVFQWAGAPSPIELVDISIGGAAMEYAEGVRTEKEIFAIDLTTPDGFTAENLPFKKLYDRTIETEEGKFETTLGGCFLDLTDEKLKQLKKIIYYNYQHYLSQTDPRALLQKNPGMADPPIQNRLQKQSIPEGVLPICSYCKRIRDPNGAWHTIESYINRTLEVNLSHGICPHCAPKMYPWMQKDYPST